MHAGLQAEGTRTALQMPPQSTRRWSVCVPPHGSPPDARAHGGWPACSMRSRDPVHAASFPRGGRGLAQADGWLQNRRVSKLPTHPLSSFDSAEPRTHDSRVRHPPALWGPLLAASAPSANGPGMPPALHNPRENRFPCEKCSTSTILTWSLLIKRNQRRQSVLQEGHSRAGRDSRNMRNRDTKCGKGWRLSGNSDDSHSLSSRRRARRALPKLLRGPSFWGIASVLTTTFP